MPRARADERLACVVCGGLSHAQCAADHFAGAEVSATEPWRHVHVKELLDVHTRKAYGRHMESIWRQSRKGGENISTVCTNHGRGERIYPCFWRTADLWGFVRRRWKQHPPRRAACGRLNFGPIRRRKRGYILMTDQSDAESPPPAPPPGTRGGAGGQAPAPPVQQPHEQFLRGAEVGEARGASPTVSISE
eukprot:1189594-Prorocentrum_minimum.AAC.1